MEAIFQIQSKVRKDLGLRKIRVIPNQNYKRHGTKSYVYLMNRFGFNSTKPGPYYHRTRVVQRGLAHSNVPIGGRAHLHKELVKRKHGHSHGQGKASGADEADEAGQVTAEDQQNDSEYLCEVAIGTPPQTLKLDFDTGSADLWVFSTELAASSRQGHTVFDSSKSSTFKKSSGEKWKISYGDGSSASGDVGTDVVDLGGLKIQNQAVELAQQAADQFIQGTGDGLLGLAFPAINTVTPKPVQTPVTNMMSSGVLPKEAQLFTSAFYSSRDQAPNSFYTFGFIDQDLVTASGEEIAYTDIDNSQGFWMFPSTTATINGKQITVSGNTAIADTGTTLALLSDEVVEALYKQIKGATYDDQQQGWIFPTSVTIDDLPDFSVAVGDKEFTIQKEDLVFAPADANNWYGGVQSRGDNPFDILGDTFLKSIYAIWDQGNNRFGAVPKIEKTQNIDPPNTGN